MKTWAAGGASRDGAWRGPPEGPPGTGFVAWAAEGVHDEAGHGGV